MQDEPIRHLYETEVSILWLSLEPGNDFWNRADFPYLPVGDNKYADGETRRGLLQCNIEVFRTGDAGFSVSVQYANDNRNQVNADLKNDSDSLVVPGLDGYEPLMVTRTAPLGTPGLALVVFRCLQECSDLILYRRATAIAAGGFWIIRQPQKESGWEL